MTKWDIGLLIAYTMLMAYSFGKQLSAIESRLIEIRQALWDLRERR